jgi:hypothetical protein
MFLRAFAPRKICAPCLARLTDESLLRTDERLEAMVSAGTLHATIARCLNCAEEFRVYWHDATA